MALSDDAKQRLVIALASQSAGEEVAESLESGGGGSGGALEILSSPPGAPEEGQQWIESVAAQDATFLQGDNQAIAGSGVEWIDPGAVTVAQMEQLFTDTNNLTSAFLNSQQTAVTSLDRIEYTAGTTVQQIIDAVNTFTQGILGQNMLQLEQGANPGDPFNLGGPGQNGFQSDFAPPSNLLKMYKDGATWYINFQKI